MIRWLIQFIVLLDLDFANFRCFPVKIIFGDTDDNTSLFCLPVVPCLMWLISHQVKITHLLTLVTRFETILVDSKQCQGFHKVCSWTDGGYFYNFQKMWFETIVVFFLAISKVSQNGPCMYCVCKGFSILWSEKCSQWIGTFLFLFLLFRYS